MNSGRMLAFSDGVIAIIITIMVLDLKVPDGTDWKDLRPLLPVFVSYVISFVYVAIFWNHHHHLMHLVRRVTGSVLWANTHLLFWLSLIPFATAWARESNYAPRPTAFYGVVLLGCASAGWILKQVLIRDEKHDVLKQFVGRDSKAVWSTLLIAVAIPLAFWAPHIAILLYIGVALLWLIPDRRIEQIHSDSSEGA